MTLKMYGVTTGLADLRNQKVNSKEAARFSSNLIESHDARIVAPIPREITLGAMIARASFFGNKVRKMLSKTSVTTANIKHFSINRHFYMTQRLSRHMKLLSRILV